MILMRWRWRLIDALFFWWYWCVNWPAAIHFAKLRADDRRLVRWNRRHAIVFDRGESERPR